MKSRFIAMLVALPALVAGLLVFSPAEAVTHNTYVSTDYVTMSSISSTGLGGKVSVSCRGSKRCKGTLFFEGSENRKRSYSLKGNSRATMSVTMNKGSAADPFAHGDPKGVDGQYKAVAGVRLFVNEDSPRNVTVSYKVQTETRSAGRIYYNINGNAAGLSDMRIELHRVLRGGNTTLVASRAITGSTSSYFSSKLGTNNTPGPSYKMKLRAVDDSSNRHLEWWWRGGSGNTVGGSRYLREGNTVRSTKDGFVAPIFWGTISGVAPANADVRVYAPPASSSGGTVVRRELDVPSCANIFGEDEANSGGGYSIPFLPYDNTPATKNYTVMTKVSGDQVWLGSGGQRFGSCQAVLDYRFSRSNLIALNGPTLGGQNVNVGADRRTTTIKAKYSGFKPTVFDEYVRIREKVPGLSVLDTPVVADGGTGSDHEKAFSLPYGQYWVEVGRRTGCSAWYPSVYTNNKAYFNGADRGAEAWKSFRRLASLPGSANTGLEHVAIVHGASYDREGKSSGKAGWMYRDYCKAYGEGTVNSLTVSPTSASTKTTSTNDKGAIVKGHVSRTGGRTNKEMMVRLSNSGGTIVLRTDFTDSSGNFYIAGLASGKYTISVNSDSWRGIGRTFSGKHSITVKRGHTYSAGTLKFKG
ncbi:hypothetical protein [Aeromicrobium sp. 9AM]|uniref:hypothetical protein n=1 Tax=Aeromicrobium sp. 9AM TaxID=2653126 RepID=UPI0012EF4812|nr:hypothetical protein [Aeromicrobium sp. 9AM]VXB33102.1 conserved exported hypothetical protein [Aeromicrobium sp. 9AM]